MKTNAFSTMALSKFVADEAYKNLLRDAKLETRSYEDVARDWEENSSEWFHALIAIEDLPIVLAIPDLRIYAWCRCKVVADDGSEAHFHWHALVHFTKATRESWRRRATRLGVRFASRKNTFKKIKCLDHAVGVLRYLACADGQKAGRRDGDGLRTHPHTHYSRQPIEEHHRHPRGKRCAPVREEISSSIASFLDLSTKSNWQTDALHDYETCRCDRGKAGKAKLAAANEKRRAFYKTEAGIATKKKYREKADVKRRIINELQMFTVSNKAQFSKERIENLVKLL